ncbi:MAG: hypothetical protein DYG98_09620 [Haliscomenobacteraceae bacterium CHB4]|nr:hypothetical protein [Haliscomenobacteraceae bacterium CHB4]
MLKNHSYASGSSSIGDISREKGQSIGNRTGLPHLRSGRRSDDLDIMPGIVLNIEKLLAEV